MTSIFSPANTVSLVLFYLVVFWHSPEQVLGQSNLFQFTKKADTATLVPNSGELTYEDFGLPSVQNGTVAFRSAVSNTEHRVDKVLSNGNIVEVIALDGTPTNSLPSFVLGDAVVFGSNVGFGATENNSGANQFRTSGNLLVGHGGGSGGVANFYGNTVAYPSDSINQQASIEIEGGSSAFLGTAVQEGDSVPQAGGINFDRFGIYVDHNISPLPFIQNRTVAFLGFWDFGNLVQGGIYRWQQTGPQTGNIIRIADENVAIPGSQPGDFVTPALGATGFETTRHDNVFTTFHAPLPDPDPVTTARPSVYGSTVAFSYDDTNFNNGRAGVYSQNNNGVLQIVADRNTSHPTLPGNFLSFEGVSTVGSSTAFIARGQVSTVSGSGPSFNGLYLKHCNKILEIVREGQIFDGKEIMNVELGHRGLAVSGPKKFTSGLEVAFRVEFTDFSEGIYTAEYNKHCALPDVLIGDLLKPFDPTDPDDGPIGNVSLFSAPIYDDDVSVLETTLQASSTDGSTVVFGGDFSASLFGVEGPGSDDNLVDFALDPFGGVVGEQIAIQYNQPVLVDRVQLAEFDLSDSVLIQIGGQTIRVTGADAPEGNIELPGLLLPTGAAVSVAWDPLNAVGDGFSYNGMVFTAVPEPTTCILTLLGLTLVLGRRCRTVVKGY